MTLPFSYLPLFLIFQRNRAARYLRLDSIIVLYYLPRESSVNNSSNSMCNASLPSFPPFLSFFEILLVLSFVNNPGLEAPVENRRIGGLGARVL